MNIYNLHAINISLFMNFQENKERSNYVYHRSVLLIIV